MNWFQADPLVAIDFETADQGRDSACAIAVVRIEAGDIVHSEARLIRPPRRAFQFTYIHGITWEDVRDEPTFGEVLADLSSVLAGVTQLAAHNSGFDRGVMRACCAAAGIEEPEQPWGCTVQLARRVWGIRPTKLPDVCRRLEIPLQHHDAKSDAEACARIVLAARGSSDGAGLRRAPPR